MGNCSKNCKYELKVWMDKIYKYLKSNGMTEYCHPHLPSYLQNKSYHTSAVKMEMLNDTAKRVQERNIKLKVWKLKMRYCNAWKLDEARRLYNQGKSIDAIARTVYMSPNTIRRDIVGVEA